MLTNYFTLRSLVREWNTILRDAELSDVWSQERGEITIAFDGADGDADEAGRALKVSVQSPIRFAVVQPSTVRARKNAATLFPSAVGGVTQGFSIAESDRLLDLNLTDGRRIRMEVFGPRANVYLLDESGLVVDRFRQQGCAIGDTAHVARAWTLPHDLDSFCAAFDQTQGSLQKRLGRTIPVFDGLLTVETLRRADLDPAVEGPLDGRRLHVLHDAMRSVLADLESPQPTIYWKKDRAEIFSIVSVPPGPGFTAETFESVNEAALVFIRKKLSQRSFDNRHDPLRRLLETKLAKVQRSRDLMVGELAKESRADRYETFGHLLMAFQLQATRNAEELTVEDVVSGTMESVVIPLRPELSAVANAERYYDRARATRKAREQSRTRLSEMEHTVNELKALLTKLDEAASASDVERFQKKHKENLATLSSQQSGFGQEIPFRRYRLGNGYEVWVGRNAAQNDRLTMKEARNYDIWMHARGVAGSHTLLRLPRRNEKPPKKIVETAASIAAFHSKARTSELAPVIVVERRYVRKPRKSLPGTVVVEREEVLMVHPAVPGDPK